MSKVASRYAKSLIDLAVEQNKLDRILEDMQSLREAVKSRDLFLLLKSPIVPASKKTEIMKLIFEGKLDELTMAFINILITKGRESHVTEIVGEFLAQYKRIQHISTVKITSATALSDDKVEAIKAKFLTSSTTDDKLDVTTAVDPELIGGFVVEYDDKVYDASMLHKLNNLKKNFTKNLYVSKVISE